MALQKVESFEFPWEAEIIRALLESEGVQAFVFDAGHVQINWAISNAVGGVRVMVNPQDLDKAKEIVKAWRDGELEQALEDEFGDLGTTKCPSCSSIKLSTKTDWLNSLIFFLLNRPAPPQTISYKCKECQHEFKIKKEP